MSVNRSTRLALSRAGVFKNFKFWGPPAVFAGLLIGIWYGVHYLLAPHRRFLLPKPHEVWSGAFADSEIRGEIWDGLIQTTYLAFVGLCVAVFFGVLVAVLMNVSKFSERALFPWAVALQVMPVFALIPVINLWFQNIDTWFLGFDADFKKRLIVCVLIAVFPIILNTHFGLKSVDKGLHELFDLHKSSRSIRLLRLELKAATPAIFLGLRIAAGLSVIGAIVGEFFFRLGPTGIGNLIDRYRGILNYEALIGTLLVSSFLGVVIYWGFSLAGNLSTRHWHSAAQDFK